MNYLPFFIADRARAPAGVLSRGVLGTLLWTAVMLLGACALPYSLKQGDMLDAVQQRIGRPAIEQPAADGGRRLLYPIGKQAYLLRFDSQGRLQSWENVLDEAHFALIAAGMTRAQVEAQIGEPSYVWGVRYHDQTIWSYRFDTPFCIVFHVGLTPQGVVEDTSYGPDPRCERDRRFPF